MSEVMKPRHELWLDGPNYTADAVIIDTAREKILLIERSDCGQWALPGGFIDPQESALTAARREAAEETSLDVSGGQLVFRGIVDDPRNTERAWIETSAYLFDSSADHEVAAGDDARQTKWFPLADLPLLYASHQSIVERALDTIVSRQQFVPTKDASYTPVHGGHMKYEKYLVAAPCGEFFAKSYSGAEMSDEHVTYLQKEAATMSHLRTNGYPHIPSSSHMHDERTLLMDAFAPHDGWRWRAHSESLDAYIQDSLAAFAALEQMPPPADVHAIPGSLAIHFGEGWHMHDADLPTKLQPLIAQLRPESQRTAAQLLDNIDQLRRYVDANPLPDSFVFCHHDARQANIAWHPKHGAKLVDWSWADIGRPGSDATTLLIDLHKHGHDISSYRHEVNPAHCITMIGFWLEHASWPIAERNQTIRLQQLASATAAYEVLESL